MGSADLVPGVSGGTMAVILGIYPRFVAALSGLTTRTTWDALRTRRWGDAWRSIDGTFLVLLAVGIGSALVVLSTALHAALEHRPDLLYAAFFGIVAASVWPLLRSVRGSALVQATWAVIGASVAWFVTGLPSGATSDAWWSVAIAGTIAVTAMLLPGISGAFLLVVLGKYDTILSAVSRLDLAILAPFALGLVTGLLAFSRVLSWALERFEVPVVSLLAGFLVGSLRKLWPFRVEFDGGSVGVVPPDVTAAVVAAVVACVAGAVVTWVARLADRTGSSRRSPPPRPRSRRA